MNNGGTNDDSGFHLVLDGKMTVAFSDELEDRIINAMRKYPRLKVDLSGVHEIDRCGIHLIRLLQTVGGKAVDFIATSPIVEQAFKDLLAPPRGSSFAAA